MNLDNNPFDYEAANNLSDELVASYYIDDFNYSRFIQSRRNVFLVGERGSGKTMALLYNRWRLQRLIAEKGGKIVSLSKIGVYIPCNTPLTYKAEYQLLERFQASIVSEHFFVLSIVYSLVDTLAEIPDLLDSADTVQLKSEIEYLLNGEIPAIDGFFDALKAFVHRILADTQRTLNSVNADAFYEHTYSFSSLVVPVLNLFVTRIPKLQESHFLFLIDDAHALNEHQVQALNSWIAYRDHSLFSFKVAVAKIGMQSKKTAVGGSILEGHDYTTVDLEGPYLNDRSRFYGLAKALVRQRLENSSIFVSPEEFFPMNSAMVKDLERASAVVREEAERLFGGSSENQKPITDYVYKYARAHYFRSRDPKANRPPYSGFETLVYLSTGVIRNLLEPCFWMYDRIFSSISADSPAKGNITSIPPSIQTEVVLELSERRWEWLRHRIAQDVVDCTSDDGDRAFHLLDALAMHFRDRLLNHKSEPRALSFTISSQESDVMERLNSLLVILRKAQLLYLRSGPAKDKGKRETYYVPNRILWPTRGLDIQGQHARISLPAHTLWDAAQGRQIGQVDAETQQGELWDAEE